MLLQQRFLFYQQLQRLLVAGISLVAALELLAEHALDPKLRALSGFLAHSVLRGLSLTEAARLSHQFERLDLQLLTVAELSGHLPTLLGVLALHYERQYQFRLSFKKAISYPLFILCLSVSVLIIMLTCLVPQFAQLFNSMGVPLPLLTRVIMRVADWLVVSSGVALVTMLAMFFVLKIGRQRRPDLFERGLQRLPIIGRIWQLRVWQRCCHSLSVMLQAGIPLIHALPLSSAVSASALCEAALFMVAKDLQHGLSLQQAFAKQGFFPKIVVLLMAVGENTGRLDEVLQEQAISFEQELLHALALLTQWLEPLLMLGVGAIVGLIVIALYLPIFELARVF